MLAVSALSFAQEGSPSTSDHRATESSRQTPDELKRVPRVLGNEDDWWTIAAAYLANDRLTLSPACANLGTVLNHEEPAALWLQAKYEF